MYRILLLEDSKECQIVVRKALSDSNIELVIAESVSQAQAIMKTATFNLALLDVMLPDGHGFQILDDLKSNPMTSVFFLTSREELDSKVAAFESGADDYLVKPINPTELKARVYMRLKKLKSLSSSSKADSHFRKGGLEVDPSSMKVYLDQNGSREEIELTSKELKILINLLKSEDHVLSRQDLVQHVWGEKVHVLSRTIDSHVCSLRKKLGLYGACIESVPKVGYRFSLHATAKKVSV